MRDVVVVTPKLVRHLCARDQESASGLQAETVHASRSVQLPGVAALVRGRTVVNPNGWDHIQDAIEGGHLKWLMQHYPIIILILLAL